MTANPTDTFQLPVLTQVFRNPFESWLYRALVQLAYNGSEPAWSANGWSIPPIDLSSLQRDPQQSVEDETDTRDADSRNARKPKAGTYTGTKVTFTTVAVRGRIQCHPWETLSNTSNWLKTWDLHNSSIWNVSINPKDLATGYELLTMNKLSPEMFETT